jgi:hypothetical protein
MSLACALSRVAAKGVAEGEDLWTMLDYIMEDDEDDEEEEAFFMGMYELAEHAAKHLSRAPNRQPIVSGLEWVETKLQNSKACYNMFRMGPDSFHRLHATLVESCGLKSNPKSTSKEALGMFLWMLGSSQSVRQAEDRFERSMATVSHNFHRVLKCVVRLAADIIRPKDPEFKELHPRLRRRRFYPHFRDCIGAIDGTHVRCIVPQDVYMQHLCRKGWTTQNVMVVCDFDMRFTFVLSGWPGSVHDMRPFNDALTTHSNLFPHPPPGERRTN